MRACIQRVCRASVVVNGETVGHIGQGLVVLLGVAETDTDADRDWLVDKILGLRIFNDPEGKMNLSLAEVGGAVLVVSQVTPYGDCRKGRRPSFVAAASPEKAEQMYEAFVDRIRHAGIRAETGQFRTHMDVELVNDGPVTIWIDTDKTPSDER